MLTRCARSHGLPPALGRMFNGAKHNYRLSRDFLAAVVIGALFVVLDGMGGLSRMCSAPPIHQQDQGAEAVHNPSGGNQRRWNTERSETRN